MRPICLLDASNYGHFRIRTALKWYNKQSFLEPPSLTNPILLKKLIKTYFGHLGLVLKTINEKHHTHFAYKDVYYLRDCPREETWRRQIDHLYKVDRDKEELKYQNQLNSLLPGSKEYLHLLGKHHKQYLQFLHTQALGSFRKSIQVHKAEADDLIAVLTEKALSKGCPLVVIISSDHDFLQLINLRTVLFCPQLLKSLTLTYPLHPSLSPSEIYLQEKILYGDPSDSIKRVTGKVDSKEYLLNYRHNEQLISFKCIPTEIKQSILNKAF